VVDDRISEAELAQRLVVHEAAAQLTPTRELRDLGDAWLLHDPVDAEPFWNRLIAPRWPADPEAFDRRLDQAITHFATLARLPHVRPLVVGGSPPDLADRLVGYGFEWLGADRRMVLVDPEPAAERAQDGFRTREGERLTISRYTAGRSRRGPDRRLWAVDASLVLAEAFGVEPYRRAALESDVLACVTRPACTIVLLRVGDEPVAIARTATSRDGAYISSVGTRPAWRGRGLGALATAIAVSDALAGGSRFVHLAVEVDNDRARRLYERLGFRVVGEPAPDLIMR
jgi:ribosomal protein S18 acetylase RimI-like enzyme